MNIFYLDQDPVIAAQYHNKSHCIKMILETAQILSTAHALLDGEKIGKKYLHSNQLLYKPTHMNHPSAKWVRHNTACYDWGAQLLSALCDEFEYRQGKVHKTRSIGLSDWLLHNRPKNLPTGEFVPPFIAIDESFRIPDVDTLTQYRNYYMTAKRRLADWSGKINSRQQPPWFN
jgi:hypothetical protein